MPALFGRVTEAAALAARAGAAAPRTTELVLLAAFAPPSSRRAHVAEANLMAWRTAGAGSVPSISQVAVLVGVKPGIPDQSRSRSWDFTLDGHTFWVLELGQEGTFLYDYSTKQWCNFNTQGFGPNWNFTNGCMWGNRIVGADILYGVVRELDPDAVVDEGWRDIAHVVTGGIATRSRESIGCSVLRVSASVGQIDEELGSALNMRFSDDQGQTWVGYFTVPLTQGDFSGEIAYRALGSFSAPGRIFELSDSGGLIRLDGADAGLNNFDDDATSGG